MKALTGYRNRTHYGRWSCLCQCLNLSLRSLRHYLNLSLHSLRSLNAIPDLAQVRMGGCAANSDQPSSDEYCDQHRPASKPCHVTPLPRRNRYTCRTDPSGTDMDRQAACFSLGEGRFLP
jgi:hypothetical protein